MAAPLLVLQDVHLTFGGTPLLEGAELSVSAGDRLCLVGRNGSGKSTLLKMAADMIQPDQGERVIQQGTTLRYLPQEPDFTGHATALSYVEAGLGPGDDPYRARTLLEALGLTGTEVLQNLSGGTARRCALARALAPAPDILLLDEPTNHLDLPAIEWLERELQSMRSALVLISHDRRFLQNLSRATIWLDRGTTRRLAQGFGEFEAWRDKFLEEEAVEQHKLDRKIVREEDWVRYGVSGRRKRNQNRLRKLSDLRQKRRDHRGPTGSVNMTITEGETSGALVAEAKSVCKSFGDQLVVQEVSVRVRRGDRLGFIGPNGAGKTTLLKLLTGELVPDSGTIRLGENIQMVTLDQRRDTLDPKATLSEALTDGRGDTIMVGGQNKHVMSYMKDFLFAPEQARTPVGILSGGERGRLMLARALAMPSNLLVLDEPTNDLDLETLDLLQEMLADYPGTVLLVSHDRDFIDRVATSVLAFEGKGRWTEYPGGYSDMVAQRGQGVTAPPTDKAGKARTDSDPTKPAAARPAKRERLSFKESHALKTLPIRISQLQAEIARLNGEMADPALFKRDAAAFGKAAASLAEAQAALATAEDEWLALEMRREELEG